MTRTLYLAACWYVRQIDAWIMKRIHNAADKEWNLRRAVYLEAVAAEARRKEESE